MRHPSCMKSHERLAYQNPATSIPLGRPRHGADLVLSTQFGGLRGTAPAGSGKSCSSWPGASLSGVGVWTRWSSRLQKLREVHRTPWSPLRWGLARYRNFFGSLQSREVSCYIPHPRQRNISRKNTAPPAHRCGRRIVVFFKKSRRQGNHR